MGKKHQITCAAELQSLAHIRAFIDGVCAGYPEIPALADPQVRYDLKLGVEEACSNIIEHGYEDMDPGSMILRLEVDPQRVEITLTDFGHPFEPVELPAPDLDRPLDEISLGGFGLFFIYQAMDEVDYESSPAGNRLSLVKYLA